MLIVSMIATSDVCAELAIPSVFFFNDTATPEIYTLSLHDALPNCQSHRLQRWPRTPRNGAHRRRPRRNPSSRSEEHTSELQSRLHLVCRLLLEKKKQTLPHSHPDPKKIIQKR